MGRWLLLAALLTLAAVACIDESPLDDSLRGGAILDVPLTFTPTVVPSATPSPTRTPVTPTPAAGSTAEADASPTSVATTGCISSITTGATPLPSATGTPEAPNPRLQAPSGVTAPAPFAPSTLLPDFALEGQIREILGDRADDVAVVAKDLATGRGVSINANDSFYAASLFKLFVMFEVFNQEAQGLLEFSDRYTMTPYYDAYGLGPRDTELCGEYTVAELLAAMMSVSDNSAAVLLQDLVGAGNINRSMESLGLAVSRLTPEDLPTTGEDIALLLEAIATGSAVDPAASETMVALMSLEIFDNGLQSGVPASAVVAHKTGNWSTARHDAGIVFAGDTTYLAVLLSNNVDAGLIREVSEALYSYYAE